MPLETATYISELDSANPGHTDQLGQADSHMRLIKSALLATLPNWTATALTATQAAIDAAVNAVVNGTVAVIAKLGTAALPGIAFLSDANTGIYSPGADQLSITTGGTARLHVKADGSTEIVGALTADSTLAVTGAITGSAAASFGGVVTAAVGAVGAPSYTFTGDTDTGFYHAGANNPRIAANGADVVDITTSGVTVTGTLHSTGALTVDAGGATITAGALTINSSGIAGCAAQSDQETATSTVLPVTPGRQQFHPSAAKAWGFITNNGATAAIGAGYNVASVLRNSQGLVTVTFTTPFSSTNYAVIANTAVNGGTQDCRCLVISRTTSTVQLQLSVVGVSGANTLVSVSDQDFYFVAFGDQ
jgi:hypothetical protein